MRFPRDLVEALASDDAIAIVGSGLSVAAGMPSWTGLLNLMILECEQHCVRFKDSDELRQMLGSGLLLEVADECCNQLGKPLYRDFIQRTFRDQSAIPTNTHQFLMQLPFTAMLTTNYDNLLERAFIQNSKKPLLAPVYTQKNVSQLARLAGEKKFFILKMHGHADDTESIILTRRDYQDVLHLNPAYRTTLSTLFVSRTLVFVGYGLRDPDLNFIFDEQAAVYKNFARRHFAFFADPGNVLSRGFSDRFNIEVIPYDSKRKHAELGTLLQALAKEVKRHRRGRGTAQHLLPSPKVLKGSRSENLRKLLDCISEVVFEVCQNGRWLFLNRAWTTITGFEVKDSIGVSVIDYVVPDDRERHRENFNRLLVNRNESFRDQSRYLTKVGTVRWIETDARLTTSRGTITVSGTMRDITDQKNAEAEIQKLAAFVRYNPDPVMELASDGTLSYLNPAAREMARLLELSDPEAILPRDVAAITEECLRLGNSSLRQDSPINGRTLSWSFFPIIASQAVHCYGEDITERLRLEAALRHAQKLESVGLLAAGVAHDFNNVLTIIQGHSDRLLSRASGNPLFYEPLQQISAAAKRAASLTQQLLAFSSKQPMQLQPLDLNAVLANVAKMLNRILGEHISLECHCAQVLFPIEADAGMMEQVIMNLAVNARDAMPNGGQLIISTDAVSIDDQYADLHPGAREGRFVCLNLTDTGCGIDPAIIGRIFEPFFTTKERGKGSGLGLANVYGIVKQHQGWLEVNSKVGVGTTFKIFFPRTEKTREGMDNVSPLGAVTGGVETILLVEDEPVLRELAKCILQDYGYQILEACTSVEAIAVYEQYKGKIDLLFTDLVMPERMSGRELAQHLKERQPNLQILCTSGYSAEAMGLGLEMNEEFHFLQKPYPPQVLLRMVRTILDQKSKPT